VAKACEPLDVGRQPASLPLGDTAKVMSKEPPSGELVELGRSLFEAGRRADIDGLLGFYRPDVILEAPDAGLTFTGLNAIRDFYEDFFGLWDHLESELEELRDLGNGVAFAVIRNKGRPVGSRAEAQQRAAWISIWVGRKIARVDIYFDIDKGRTAAERHAEGGR
jgi:ketosteroid isomerase-like protein